MTQRSPLSSHIRRGPLQARAAQPCACKSATASAPTEHLKARSNACRRTAASKHDGDPWQSHVGSSTPGWSARPPDRPRRAALSGTTRRPAGLCGNRRTSVSVLCVGLLGRVDRCFGGRVNGSLGHCRLGLGLGCSRLGCSGPGLCRRRARSAPPHWIRPRSPVAASPAAAVGAAPSLGASSAWWAQSSADMASPPSAGFQTISPFSSSTHSPSAHSSSE